MYIIICEQIFMTGPWVLRTACVQNILQYLLPSEQIAYCTALLLPIPVSKRYEYRYPDGSLFEVKYRMGKYLHGSCQRYTQSGQLISDSMLVDGKLHGTWFKWYDDGTLKETVSYARGVKNGPTRTWYPTGDLESEYFYVDDKMHGPFQIVNTYCSYRGTYANDKLHGCYEINLRYRWRCRSLCYYEHGQVHGPQEFYYDNGQLQSRRPHKYNKLHGLVEEYDNTGQLLWRYNYKDGQKDGLCEFWNSHRQKYLYYYYKDDKLVKNESCEVDLSEIFN